MATGRVKRIEKSGNWSRAKRGEMSHGRFLSRHSDYYSSHWSKRACERDSLNVFRKDMVLSIYVRRRGPIGRLEIVGTCRDCEKWKSPEGYGAPGPALSTIYFDSFRSSGQASAEANTARD